MSLSHHVRFDDEPQLISVKLVPTLFEEDDYDEEKEEAEVMKVQWEDKGEAGAEEKGDEEKEEAKDEGQPTPQDDPPSNPPNEVPQQVTTNDDNSKKKKTTNKKKKKKEKLPPFQLLRWQEQNKNQVIRHELFRDLRAYEAQRRTTFSAKLEATQLYFKSLMDLLENSINETTKVYRLALGTSIAQSQYARAITQTSEHQVPRDASPTAALLHAWQEANFILAATLEDNAVNIETDVVSVLRSFQDALQDQKTQFETVGKPLLKELEHMEEQVQQTWDAYWKTASKSMDSETLGLPIINAFVAEDTGNNDNKEEEHLPVEDLWVREMQYQISVSLQRSTWERRGPEIVRLASSSKEMEVARRIKLNECRVQFLQCLSKLFKTIGEEGKEVKLPPNAAAIIKPLKNVQSEIEQKVKSEVDASLGLGALELSLPDDSAAGFGLDCDGLVMTARVMEWKNTLSAMSAADRWKTALAVVTVDGYLHLFDLSPFCNTTNADSEEPRIFPGCDPNIAMEHLFPLFKQQQQEHEKEGETLAQGRAHVVGGIRDKMVPERTVRLSKQCSFQLLNDECCEVIQKSANKTRFLGVGQKTLYKAQLRILSSDPGISSEKERFFTLLQQATNA